MWDADEGNCDRPDGLYMTLGASIQRLLKSKYKLRDMIKVPSLSKFAV